jgi:hypothetical protein
MRSPFSKPHRTMLRLPYGQRRTQALLNVNNENRLRRVKSAWDRDPKWFTDGAPWDQERSSVRRLSRGDWRASVSTARRINDRFSVEGPG